MRDTIFTKYDLERGTPNEIQFDIMEMPQFFHENGEAPKQAHIRLYGFSMEQVPIMLILKNIP